MLNCPVIYFHNYDVDGKFRTWWLLVLNNKMLKGLDELPSGDGVLPHSCRLG